MERPALKHQPFDWANPDPRLASCDPAPPEAAAWRKSLEAAGVDDVAYAKALAGEIKTIAGPRKKSSSGLTPLLSESGLTPLLSELISARHEQIWIVERGCATLLIDHNQTDTRCKLETSCAHLRARSTGSTTRAQAVFLFDRDKATKGLHPAYRGRRKAN